ncbi:kelch domain-containing protein 10 homolog isoform X2 [Musca domestica]|nr:kelch domain-containing protein 10 homolog isoform X2 [Musca domestica]XP_011295220.1 kelch domain-containing protein 10 homolog isoform X2 [Musca domestica]XP_011295221.1 kelch domain-containing protein 10 homolog isoform X2 [Musca domestica]XP_011295222.1 kelch domain-containing protein 10 homolog isoform X2 [Musca domestica]
MDQEDEHERQQPGQGHDYEPLEEIGAQEEYVAMDVVDDSDNESDGADDGDDDDESSDDYDVLEDLVPQDSWSSDEIDCDDDSNFGHESVSLQRLHRMLNRCRERVKHTYSFQPLRLIPCQYKAHHDAGEFPIARSGHRIIASESHLYSLGGYNPNRTPNVTRFDACMLFQELWAFNFATGRWKLLLNAENSEMPRELASNALVIYNNVLISHGGTGYPFGETCSNDCYVYTTGENPKVMLLKVTGDLPTAQYGPGIVIHNDYLYTIGGTTGFDYSCDVYRLNLQTKVWENVYICRPEMRDDPEGRYRHEVVYDGHHIYVLGGGTSHTVYDLQRIPAFNLETNRWDHFDTLPDRTVAINQDLGYPKARKCLSCVQHTTSNGDIEAFITGGLQGDFNTYFDDIWKLNLRTKQWYKIHTAVLPRPLYFHSAAHAGNGCMYIFGGIEYNEVQRDMRRRNHLFKMWMTIPKLSDICWDAITYYNRNLHKFDRATLLNAGIPQRYVNRLPPLPERMRKHASDEPSSSTFLNGLTKRMRAHLE